MIHELLKPVCTPALALAISTLAACGGGAGQHATEAAHSLQTAVGQEQPSLQQPQQTPAALSAEPAVQASAPSAAAEGAPWRIAAHPADTHAAPGEAASFQVGAEGGSGAFEYQWLRDGEPIDGATGQQYSFVTKLDDGGATFTVRVRPRGAGAGQERESAPATLAWRDGDG
jgi:hypothetical protein